MYTFAVREQAKRVSISGDKDDISSNRSSATQALCKVSQIFCDDINSFVSKAIQIYHPSLHEAIINRIASQIEYFFPRLMKAFDVNTGDAKEKILQDAAFIAGPVLGGVLEKLKAAIGKNATEIEKFKRAMLKSLSKRGFANSETSTPASGEQSPKEPRNH